jgi:hypothetical protein
LTFALPLFLQFYFERTVVKASVKQIITEGFTNVGLYIPQELLDSNLKSSSSKKRRDDAFQDLEKAENAGDKSGDKPKVEDGSDDEVYWLLHSS